MCLYQSGLVLSISLMTQSIHISEQISCCFIYSTHYFIVDSTSNLKDWLRTYIIRHGDFAPNRDVVYLPSNLTKTYLFKAYCKIYHKPKEAVSKAQFFRTWDRYFKKVKIPEVYDR